MSVGQRLCIDFFVSRANLRITLRSHLNITYSYCFWSSLGLNVVVGWLVERWELFKLELSELQVRVKALQVGG